LTIKKKKNIKAGDAVEDTDFQPDFEISKL
jgi:hypothetical protein